MGHGFVENLSFLWDCILELIYCGDEKCILCKSDLYNDRYICKSCKNNIKICKDSFTNLNATAAHTIRDP